KLLGKKIGIVTNHTGIDRDGMPVWKRIGGLNGVDVVALFSPEHGLFGEAAAGEHVDYKGDRTDAPRRYSLVQRDQPDESGVGERDLRRLYSLYGRMRKPSPEMLKGIDLLVYDIQDIGARPFTYITTLGMVLEAGGENGLPVMVLDRPNPLTGVRLDGPTLHLPYRSFVGYFPIPIEYGLTPGELANMIVGESWIDSKPSLEVIPLVGWVRESWYDNTDLPWVAPSPNIPDLTTAIVYPGMVLIEATNVSEGRGTDHPFLWIGAPWIDGDRLALEMNRQNLPGVTFAPVTFVPSHLPGVAHHPKYEGTLCNGVAIEVVDRSSFKAVAIGVALLVTIKNLYSDSLRVQIKQLDRLVGTDIVSRGLDMGWRPGEILQMYQEDLTGFRKMRMKYLLY
ncbi:MAG: DUF1343 domain-containing protein, partial [Fidelibacterota bacterium]